ncbi:MAG: sulfite exporter TauE/SafE family protein [Ignavibacteria bacterium]|nr:sulfite exporter TauE/SafE family protein [Ignavibacteria bacterium]
MSDLTSALILFGVGAVSGFMNVVAGGGSSLTLPALIFLGLDSTVANGTNRIAVIMQNVSAVYAFKREKYQQFGLSMKLSLITLPGTIAGAFFALSIGDELFEKILGIIMIGVIISMVIPNPKIRSNESSDKIPWTVHLSMFGIGFYGGFIQVGIGFMIMAALQYLMKLNLIIVNMHKVFIVLILTIPAFVVFLITGNINWQFGVSLAAGNAFGAWWAAKLSIRKGESFIKTALIVTVFIMALKLLDVF